MKIYSFCISGQLPGLNELIKQMNYNRFAGAALKKKYTHLCQYSIKSSNPQKFDIPITIEFTWVEPNLKRDPDNITAGAKFILDALVKEGVIPNDTRRWVHGISHIFETPDKHRPRVGVTIKEVDDGWIKC